MTARPWVTLNAAMTADGKIDTFERRGASISPPADWRRVDRLRAESDAIMVGGRTLLQEDPRLTVRSAALRAKRRRRGLPEQPMKVGVVSRASLDPRCRFLTHGQARVVIFTTFRTPPEEIDRLRESGAEVHRLGQERVDLPAAMGELGRMGVARLLVEGGGTLNAELLRLRLVDEVQIYLAPLVFGGATAPTLADGPGLRAGEAVELELRSVQRRSGGVLLSFVSPARAGPPPV